MASPAVTSRIANPERRIVLSHRRAIFLFVGAVVALVLLIFAAIAGVGLDGYVAFATVGTALATLSLAYYTSGLAGATRESVNEGNRLTDLAYSQLKEVQAQRDLIAEQAEKAGMQAEATRRLADASEASTMEAAKARIDAIAPLIHMTVSLLNVQVTSRGPTGRTELLRPTDEWYEPQLRELVFRVTLVIQLQNVGASPAQLSFGDTSAYFENVVKRGIHSVALGPGGGYHDHYVLSFMGDEAKRGRLLGIPVTYNGLLHGEMFDHVQWKGWVTPLLFTDGVARANDTESIVNAGGAQVIRSYPNLERPADMDQARARLLEQPTSMQAP